MTNPNFTPSTQETIEAEIKKVSENRREILRLIHEAVFDKSMSDAGRITTVMARSSTLLVSLSEQADSIQKKMIYLTWIITILTTALVVLTLVLLFK